jgi:hypothetical protein
MAAKIILPPVVVTLRIVPAGPVRVTPPPEKVMLPLVLVTFAFKAVPVDELMPMFPAPVATATSAFMPIDAAEEIMFIFPTSAVTAAFTVTVDAEDVKPIAPPPVSVETLAFISPGCPRVTAPAWVIVIALFVPGAVMEPDEVLPLLLIVNVPAPVDEKVMPEPVVTAALMSVPVKEFMLMPPASVARAALTLTVDAEDVKPTAPPPVIVETAPPKVTAPGWLITIFPPVPDAVMMPKLVLPSLLRLKAEVVPPVEEKALPEAAITLTGPEMSTFPGVGVLGVMIKVAASTEAAPVTLTPPPAWVTSIAPSSVPVPPAAPLKLTKPAADTVKSLPAPAIAPSATAPVVEVSVTAPEDCVRVTGLFVVTVVKKVMAFTVVIFALMFTGLESFTVTTESG